MIDRPWTMAMCDEHFEADTAVRTSTKMLNTNTIFLLFLRGHGMLVTYANMRTARLEVLIVATNIPIRLV